MISPLFEHQKEAIKFLLDKKRCILAGDPGTGKTRSALEAAAQKLNYDWTEGETLSNVLIVCPASLRRNWLNEIAKFIPDWTDFSEIQNTDDLKKEFTADPALGAFRIISYQAFLNGNVREWIGKHYLPDIIIFDESHDSGSGLRNLRSKTFQFMKKQLIPYIRKYNTYTWFLTGTPIVTCADDILPTLQIIEDGWHDAYKFRELFCLKREIEVYQAKGANSYSKRPIVQWYGFNPKGMPKLKEMINNRILLRQYKSDVLKSLPPKIVQDIYLKEAEGKDYVDYVELEMESEPEDLEIETDEAFAVWNRMNGREKVPEILEFITRTFPICIGGANRKFVLFVRHLEVVDLYFDTLTKAGYAIAAITGRETQLERGRNIEHFQMGDVDVLICTYGAGGIGITLTAASYVILAEMPYSQAEQDQAVDRLHRPGQENAVTIYRMIKPKSHDEVLRKYIENKKKGMIGIVGYDEKQYTKT